MEASPNEESVAFYDGDTLIWITPSEYYLREAGGVILRQFGLEIDDV